MASFDREYCVCVQFLENGHHRFVLTKVDGLPKLVSEERTRLLISGVTLNESKIVCSSLIKYHKIVNNAKESDSTEPFYMN